MLIDFENIAAGTEKEGLGSFNVRAVMRKLKDRGRILVSRAYGDWGRFAKFKQSLLEQAITMVELTSYRGQEKNRADIALVVDAMELAFTRDHLDTFVVLSGDSDFTPLVTRLKELNRRVIGCGTRGSTSRLLMEACDEFMFYDNLIRSDVRSDPRSPMPIASREYRGADGRYDLGRTDGARSDGARLDSGRSDGGRADNGRSDGGRSDSRYDIGRPDPRPDLRIDSSRSFEPARPSDSARHADSMRSPESDDRTPADSDDAVATLPKAEAFELLVETVQGLLQNDPRPVLASVVKASLLRKEPAFDETEYGFRVFARFLEAAQDSGLVNLTQDEKAGGYRVDLAEGGEAIERSPVVDMPLMPALDGEAGRLRAMLAARGLDPLSALYRHTIVYEFADHVTERSTKKKRNTLQYTIGDVVRRCRTTDPEVPAKLVRPVIMALYKAGELLHADGHPVRSASAPFTVNKDADGLLRSLDRWYLRALLDAGEPLDDGTALSRLLHGNDDHANELQQIVAQVRSGPATTASSSPVASAIAAPMPSAPAAPAASTNLAHAAAAAPVIAAAPSATTAERPPPLRPDASASPTAAATDDAPVPAPRRRRRKPTAEHEADLAATKPSEATVEPVPAPKRRRVKRVDASVES